MSSYRRIILLIVALVLVAAGLALIAGGRGCRAEPPPPATIAPTVTSTAVLVTRQTPTGEPTSTQGPRPASTATDLPETATNTPTAEFEASATPSRTPVAPTPELLGTHRVRRGETMWGIGLQWYPRRWFLWAEDVWRPICEANPQIADCRMIFPGDVLRVPRLR